MVRSSRTVVYLRVDFFLTCVFFERCFDVSRYSTGSNLNTYSALIQNFYSQETGSHQAIHVAVNTGTEDGQEPIVKAYIRHVFTFLIEMTKY